MHCHQLDVDDVNVAVFVDVEALVIAIVPTSAAPATGHLHYVHDIHIAVAVQVAEEP